MRKIVAFLLVLMLSFINNISVLANPQDMTFGGINYIETKDTSAAFKNNFWHTGFQESDMMMPIREMWSTWIGESYSQPVVDGDYLYTLAGDKLVEVSLKAKTCSGSISIQSKDYKPSSSHLTLIKNGDGTFNVDKLDRLVFGTRDGKVTCVKLKESGGLEDSWVDWTFTATAGKKITSNPAFIFDAITEKPYIIFGCADFNFYILNINGGLVKKVLESGEITSSPLPYYKGIDNLNNSQLEELTYSMFAYGVDGGFGTIGGYLSVGRMDFGNYISSFYINKSITQNYKMSGIPASISAVDTDINNTNKSIIFNTDKEGNIYCISLIDGKLLFKISKYYKSVNTGEVIINNTPCVDEDYLYITYSNYNLSGKAKFVAIDYKKAIRLGACDPYSSSINNAIVFESSDSEFTGTSYAGSTIVRLAVPGENTGDTDIKGKVAFVGDRGESNNFRAFYIDKSVGTAVRVKDAFLVFDTVNKKYITCDTLSFPNGCTSEPLYTDRWVYIVDGNNTLHALSASEEKNLAILNMSNSKIPVQKGKQYEVTANIANYWGKSTTPLDIEYSVLNEKEEVLAHTTVENITIPVTGLLSTLQYNVPFDYPGKKFYIRCELNSKGADKNRKFIEEMLDGSDPYADNTHVLEIPIAEDVNLKVNDATPKTYKEKVSVTTHVTFTNDSDFDLQDIPAKITIEGVRSVTETKVSIKAHGTVDVPVVWTTPEVPSEHEILKLNLTAIINESQDISETNYEDNKKVIVLEVKKEIPDLEVVSITPTNYKEGTRVISLVTVRNNSSKDFEGDNKIDLKFSLNSSNKTDMIDLGSHSERALPYTWNTPVADSKVTITAEINPDRSIVESNYTNNKKSIKAVINKEEKINTFDDVVAIIPPPTPCTNARKEWTESRFDHWASSSWSHSVTNSDGTTSSCTHTSYYAVYKDYNFYAQLNITSSSTPTGMKSGYGFRVAVTTALDTDYDFPSKIVGPQRLYAYFPEHQYTVPIELEATSTAGSLNNTWHFYLNDDSVLGNVEEAKEHYIPVWFPDKTDYIVQFWAKDATSPGGGLCAATKNSIYIDGNLYEDDTTREAR